MSANEHAEAHPDTHPPACLCTYTSTRTHTRTHAHTHTHTHTTFVQHRSAHAQILVHLLDYTNAYTRMTTYVGTRVIFAHMHTTSYNCICSYTVVHRSKASGTMEGLLYAAVNGKSMEWLEWTCGLRLFGFSRQSK